jgi:hypothetical protein
MNFRVRLSGSARCCVRAGGVRGGRVVVESKANEGHWRLSESIDAVIGMFRSK